jgi:hypothetical protein
VSTVSRRHGHYGGYAFFTSKPSTVHVSLLKGFICGKTREVIGAVRRMVIFKEIAAFDTTFVIVQKFTLRVKKFRALFSWFR